VPAEGVAAERQRAASGQAGEDGAFELDRASRVVVLDRGDESARPHVASAAIDGDRALSRGRGAGGPRIEWDRVGLDGQAETAQSGERQHGGRELAIADLV